MYPKRRLVWGSCRAVQLLSAIVRGLPRAVVGQGHDVGAELVPARGIPAVQIDRAQQHRRAVSLRIDDHFARDVPHQREVAVELTSRSRNSQLSSFDTASATRAAVLM